MQRNMYLWIDEQIKRKKKKAIPVLSFPGIQLLNISVQELVSSSDLQAKCIKVIADRYPTAASLSNMDLSIEAEAFGATIKFMDREVPTVLGSLVHSIDDAVSLKIPAVGTKRTRVAIKAMETAINLISDRPLFAGVIGPFSLAGRLMELTELMIKCMIEPETAHIIIKKTAKFLIEYIKEFKRTGTNGVIIAEPAAGLLSPELCKNFSSLYLKEIINEVEDENFIVIYHNCGNSAPLVDEIILTGAKVIHLGNAVKLIDLIDKYPKDKLIMGNLDPAKQFKNGTPESISKETMNLLRELSHKPNWIISSGCDISPLTPISNIDAFFTSVTNFYK